MTHSVPVAIVYLGDISLMLTVSITI